MTALGIFGLSVFLTLMLNLGRVLDEVGKSVGVVAFLDVDAGDRAGEAADRARAMAPHADVVVVPPAAADARVQRALHAQPLLAEEARGVSVGWVLEVRPTARGEFDGRKIAQKLKAIPTVDEVMHPGGEVEDAERLLNLLRGAALFLAALIAFVVVLVVNNTVKLTLYARREEIAILKLVGATDSFVRTPFLVEGAVQGLLGAGAALCVLYGLSASITGLLETVLVGFTGGLTVEPLPLLWAGILFLGAGALGVLGAAVSIGRFLKV